MRFASLLIFAHVGFSAAHAGTVAVSATAAADYQRTVPGQPGLRPETYVFMAGRHFSGSLRDASEEKTPFLAIAKTLAAGLVRQNYFPAKDPNLAELMIVVHWGTTQVYDDPEKQLTTENLNSAIATYSAEVAATGTGNTGELSQLISMRNAGASLQERNLAVNAGLLGFEQSLLKESAGQFLTNEGITMRAELGEERYFVILMAYDYQALKKEKKRRLLWVTRLSMRSPGNNFTTAVPMMTQTGVDFFGRQQDGLAHVDTKLRDAKVDVGLPTVVPSEPAAVTTPTTEKK